MLVLQRLVGEQVQIGPEIVVTILHSARGRVRFGIDAPEGTNIRRSELESESLNDVLIPQTNGRRHKPK